MTIGGWFLFGFFALLLSLFGLLTYLLLDECHGIAVTVCVAVVVVATLAGMLWYYNNTADGARRLKDQKSNFEYGLNRTIMVYDRYGDLIHRYEGKIDFKFDSNDRMIIFDDENGKRHEIYCEAGTVLIDEQ